MPVLLSRYGLRPWELDRLTGAELEALDRHARKLAEGA